MKKTLAILLAIATVLSCLGVVFAGAEGFMRGEIAGTGELDAIDYMLLKRAVLGTFLLSEEQLEAADIDGDGIVTVTDYRLLKQYILGTFTFDTAAKGKGYPARGEETDFALDLRSSVEMVDNRLIATVVLTLGEVKDGVRMQDLLATLRYDPEELTLITPTERDQSLDCFTVLPYNSYSMYSEWENLTTAGESGVINIALAVPNDPEQYLDAEHSFELTFTFEMQDGIQEATVTVPSGMVRGVYSPSDKEDDLAVFYGEGSSTTATNMGFVREPNTDYKFVITDFEATVTKYNGPGGDVVIPSKLGGMPVTAIGELAFYDRDDITSVTIPEGVKEIGDRAFWFCTGLTAVNLPDSLTTIGYDAFAFCEKLANIKLPDNISLIGDLAFYYCQSLTSARIPKGTTELGRGSFAGCKLTSLTVDPQNPVYYSDGNCIIERNTATLVQGCTASVIPQGVKTIREFAFYVCSGLTDIQIPFGVETIERSAFDSCKDLTYIVLPDSVKIIEETAFSDCTNLESVTLGSGVEFIGWNAFFFTGLKSIFIPISVTEMEAGAFQSCDSLTDIYCEAPEKPAGWSDYWMAEIEATVHWGYKTNLGDLDGNGEIDSMDYLMLKRYCLGSLELTEEQKAVSDVNGDGEIDGLDYMMVKRHVLGTYAIA